MDYIELELIIIPRDPWTEILIAELAEAGYESFVETEEGVKAYIPADVFNEEEPIPSGSVLEGNEEVNVSLRINCIPQQNWNAQWEADFSPVKVEGYLTILAPFHEREGHEGMIVEILPKMSFGTGHHQTTWMMSKALFELDTLPENVLDMGTGTGVLAIIAEKLGAKRIVAVDIEDWSVENTVENAERNECSCIEARLGDVDVLSGERFGLILANINKNVLKQHMPFYSEMLQEGGVLMLSGFFESDVEELSEAATKSGLRIKRMLNRDNWAAIECRK